MKTEKTWLFLLLGCIFLISNNTKEAEDVIYWTDDYKLDWSDFKGEPREDFTNLAALTSSGIVYYSGCDDGKLIYKIKSYFDRNESWVKDPARDAHHLEHEQVHFDITELYARKLRKMLELREFKCYEELDFKRFIDAYLTNWEVEQRMYDIKSSFSINKRVQKEWCGKISKELKELEPYKE